MSTPPEVMTEIATLTRDIFDTFQVIGGQFPGYDPKGSANMSELVARSLIRRGWRHVGGELPVCPSGRLLCFDPEPGHRC